MALTPSVPRQQLGPPLAMTDEELTAAATITPADVARAIALWHALAPRWAQSFVDEPPRA